MNAIFITGDRMFSPIYAPLITIELLRAVNEGRTIMTGTNDGVEAFTRSLADEAGVAVMVTENVQGENGKPDWAARAASLPTDVDVVVIHADPMTSSVAKGTMTALDETRVTLRGMADLLG